jgi:hypothetical protein
LAGVVVSLPRSGFHLMERLVVECLIASGSAASWKGHLAPQQTSEALDAANRERAISVINFHLESNTNPSPTAINRVFDLIPRGTGLPIFTKCHDTFGDFPTDLDHNYVVLVRSPFQAALSNFYSERIVGTVPDLANEATLREFVSLLPSQHEFASYYRSYLGAYARFYRKWILQAPESARIVHYDEFLAHADSSLLATINLLFPGSGVNSSSAQQACSRALSEHPRHGQDSTLLPDELGVAQSARSRLLMGHYESAESDFSDQIAALTVGRYGI